MNFLSNPYCAIGQAHNNGLDYVIGNIPQNPTLANILKATADYMLSIAYNGTTYTTIDDASVQALVAAGYNGVFSVEKLKCAGKFSRKQLEIIDILLNPNPTISNANLSDFYLNMGYEIMATSMPIEQMQPLLVCAAVGQYSSDYWNTQLNNPNSPWLPYLNNGAARLPAWVKNDAAGALGGAIAGALGAWWTGTGVIAAAAATAIGSAVTASVSTIIA